MKEKIKKSIFFGLGLAAVTKDTIEKFIYGLVKEGELTVKEGKDLAKDVVKESSKAQKHVRNLVDSQVKAVVKNIPFATKADLKKLEKKLRKS